MTEDIWQRYCELWVQEADPRTALYELIGETERKVRAATLLEAGRLSNTKILNKQITNLQRELLKEKERSKELLDTITEVHEKLSNVTNQEL